MNAHWTEQTIQPEGQQPIRLHVHRNAGETRGTPLVLHLHGGAFVGGSSEPPQAVAALLADVGASVISVDYPTAPDQPFPYALESSFAALQWAYSNCPHVKHSRIFVAGEEAGGNLAAGLALMARDRQSPPLAGQILLSPMLDPCLATQSIRKAEAGPVGCKWADGWHSYLGSADKASHPYASPLNATRLAGLAPALVITAEDDPMRDESLTYVRRLRESGVCVQEHILTVPTAWPDGLQHIFQTPPAWVETVRTAFSDFFATATTPCTKPKRAHQLTPPSNDRDRHHG